MKKILILSQFYMPDKSGTGKIIGEIFSSLSKRFNITVVSGRQSYKNNNILLPKKENILGVDIYRCVDKIMNMESAFGRIYSWTNFFFSSCLLIFSKRLFSCKDILIATSNPPMLPLLLLLFGNKRRKIYILHDLYPDIAVALGVLKINNIFARLMKISNRIIFKYCDDIVVLGDDVASYLRHNYSVDRNKIKIIPNFFKDVGFVQRQVKDKIRIIYAGNIGRFHHFDELLKCIDKLEKFELYIIGDGNQRERLINLYSNNKRIKFFHMLNDIDYETIMKTADLFYISLEQGLTGLAVPSKFYSYLSFGRGIICVSDNNTQIRRHVENYACGFGVNVGDYDTLFQKLYNIIDDEKIINCWSHNARRLYEERFSKVKVLKEWEALLLNNNN